MALIWSLLGPVLFMVINHFYLFECQSSEYYIEENKASEESANFSETQLIDTMIMDGLRYTLTLLCINTVDCKFEATCDKSGGA